MAMQVFFVMAFMNSKTVRPRAVFCLCHFPAERSRQSGLLLWRQFFGQSEFKLLEQSAVCSLMGVSGLPIILGSILHPSGHISVAFMEQFGMFASVPSETLNMIAADDGAR